jgi:hypothetical protein
MRPIQFVNDIIPLVIRSLETGDNELLNTAHDELSRNSGEWMNHEVNTMIENLIALVEISMETNNER